MARFKVRLVSALSNESTLKKPRAFSSEELSQMRDAQILVTRAHAVVKQVFQENSQGYKRSSASGYFFQNVLGCILMAAVARTVFFWTEIAALHVQQLLPWYAFLAHCLHILCM